MSGCARIVRRLKAVLCFAILAVLLDVATGAALHQLYRRTKTGEAGGSINYAISREAQVLLLGSSRMKHHAVPSVLSQRLSMNVFNAAIDGHDFLYALMLMDLWKRTNTPPRIIILHVDPNSFNRVESELQKTAVFSFYFDESRMVREILCRRSPFERIKYFSRCYRANGKVLPIIKNLFVHPDSRFDGFEALSGTLPPSLPKTPFTQASVQVKTTEFWDLKIRCFEALVDYCRQNGTCLFLVHSPRYREGQMVHDAWVNELSKFLVAYPEVEFIDISEFTYPEIFAGKPGLFKDESHLNGEGAKIFSELLATALKARMKD